MASTRSSFMPARGVPHRRERCGERGAVEEPGADDGSDPYDAENDAVTEDAVSVSPTTTSGVGTFPKSVKAKQNNVDQSIGLDFDVISSCVILENACNPVSCRASAGGFC